MSTRELAEATNGFYKKTTIRGIETGHTPASEAGITRICDALPDSAENIMTTFKTATVDTSRGADSGLPRMRSNVVEAEMFAGDWHAFWQTSRDGSQAVLLEKVNVAAVSKRRFDMKSIGTATWSFVDGIKTPADLKHFAWRASCEILPPGRINGCYTCITRPPVYGLLWLEITAFSEMMVGYWLGDSWDSSTMVGAVVLGRSQAGAQQRFERECEAQSVLTLPHGCRP